MPDAGNPELSDWLSKAFKDRERFHLHPYQAAYMEAFAEHPPPKHRWRIVVGRKWTRYYCDRCQVPVNEPAVALSLRGRVLWWWRRRFASR